MEIQKIFSEIDTEEKIYSVLMSEEELALFSEIQKEFNSKAQKALRKVYDSAVGKEYTHANTLYNQQAGRGVLKKLGVGNGVNASITEKALVNGSYSVKERLPHTSLIRGVGKKSWASPGLSPEYDHDHVYKPTSEVIKSAKEIMKKSR